MLRVGASVGLRPWEVYAMTPRELEVFIQGHEETWGRIRELAAWVQSNLMNAHGGKKKVKPDQLLPAADVKKRKQAQSKNQEPKTLMGMNTKDVAAMFSERRLQRDEAAYWASPAGKRIKALRESMDYGDGAQEE